MKAEVNRDVAGKPTTVATYWPTPTTRSSRTTPASPTAPWKRHSNKPTP